MRNFLFFTVFFTVIFSSCYKEIDRDIKILNRGGNINDKTTTKLDPGPVVLSSCDSQMDDSTFYFNYETDLFTNITKTSSGNIEEYKGVFFKNGNNYFIIKLKSNPQKNKKYLLTNTMSEINDSTAYLYFHYSNIYYQQNYESTKNGNVYINITDSTFHATACDVDIKSTESSALYTIRARLFYKK